MSRRLRYARRAKADLDAVWDYVSEAADPEIADSVIERLRAQCQKLAQLPATLGTTRPELRENIRSTPCMGYIIFFRYRENSVEILNILAAARDIHAYFGDGED